MLDDDLSNRHTPCVGAQPSPDSVKMTRMLLWNIIAWGSIVGAVVCIAYLVLVDSKR